MSQGKELQHTLSGEDNNESHVNFEEEIFHLCALVVRLHHHGHHIEADEHHDEDVKELLTDEVKHHPLDKVLQVRGRQGETGGRGRQRKGNTNPIGSFGLFTPAVCRKGQCRGQR